MDCHCFGFSLLPTGTKVVHSLSDLFWLFMFMVWKQTYDNQPSQVAVLKSSWYFCCNFGFFAVSFGFLKMFLGTKVEFVYHCQRKGYYFFGKSKFFYGFLESFSGTKAGPVYRCGGQKIFWDIPTGTIFKSKLLLKFYHLLFWLFQ